MSPALTEIIRLLDTLDTREIHQLQYHYLPLARQKAVESESRTPPVRLRESEKTTYVEADVIRREHGRAEVAAHAEGELD